MLCLKPGFQFLSTNEHVDKRNEMNQNETSSIQPPLPPNPPPPDSPPVIKKEKEDEETSCDSEAIKMQNNENENGISGTELAEEDDAKLKRETMCRNYIRGTCDRGSSCIFVHRVIRSQLKDVYKFCIDFQNPSGCTRPQCKFVHATVFEKENFYKTAYLPPHTVAHLKMNNKMPPPPNEEVPNEVRPVFMNQPPPPIPSEAANVVPPKPVENSTTASLESRLLSEILKVTADIKTPLKREWNDIDEFPSLSRELELGSPTEKKCKHCDKNEFRFQCLRNKLEKHKQACNDINKKTALLNIKTARLYTLFSKLLSSKQADRLTTHLMTSNGNSSSFIKHSNNELDGDLVDQLGIAKGTSNIFSLFSDDSSKINSLSNNFLAKFIQTMREMGEKL